MKRYTEMNADELAEATREFDGEVDPKRLGPLAPEMRRRWERAQASPNGRILSFRVDDDLLERLEAYAATHGETLGQVVARGVRLATADDASA